MAMNNRTSANCTVTSTQRGNVSCVIRQEPDEQFSYDDATWVLTSSIVIFTMQTGFGLLESGCVAPKNEVNILMKNAADIVLGGVTYWVFGYGLQYSKENSSIAFGGRDYFMIDADISDMGLRFCEFIFQLSFSTTATTIVSGAMAERTNYNAYCIFSLLNTIVYCIPAGWVWGNHGFLKALGALDFAGSGCVHLLGGVSALVAALFLGPRQGRFETRVNTLYGGEQLDSGGDAANLYGLSNPINVIYGTLTLWWGWLVFNCGSSFGVTHKRWMYASRAAVTTINASVGGGVVGIVYTYYINKKLVIEDVVNSILVALVSVTAGSGYFSAYDGLVVGVLGAVIACHIPKVLEKWQIDDPVGAFAVHAIGGFWGMLAVGIFLQEDTLLRYSNGNSGLFKGGGLYLAGVQLLTCFCIIVWSGVVTYTLLKAIDVCFVKIRMSPAEEALGADFCEHGIMHPAYDYELAMDEVRRTLTKIPRLPGGDPRLRTEPPAVPNRRTYDHRVIHKYFSGHVRRAHVQRLIIQLERLYPELGVPKSKSETRASWRLPTCSVM